MIKPDGIYFNISWYVMYTLKRVASGSHEERITDVCCECSEIHTLGSHIQFRWIGNTRIFPMGFSSYGVERRGNRELLLAKQVILNSTTQGLSGELSHRHNNGITPDEPCKECGVHKKSPIWYLCIINVLRIRTFVSVIFRDQYRKSLNSLIRLILVKVRYWREKKSAKSTWELNQAKTDGESSNCIPCKIRCSG